MNLIKSITLGASLMVASICQAHITVYTAALTGPAEAPPNTSAGTGFATITMDMDLITMRVQATFSGLEGNVTNAHIHAPTIVAGTGTAGVATRTPTFTGFPSGTTFGTYDLTFDMSVAGSYNASFITNNGGTVSGALNAFVAALDGGKAYFNIHSSTYPGGEIRGFLTAVPEPSSYAALAGLGALGTVVATRRRR